MARTPDQIAADEALTEAIQRVWHAYYCDADKGILLEYVVLARSRSFDEVGDALTAHALMPRDGDVPIDLMLGMTEYASTRLRKRIAEDEET
ncbi:hypothetical protein F8M49_20850 [Rhodococcus zopfii]|uniref:Uncharacterized protein n=1 Tax=Rhodococcus zopfii TaxID=43772 RepID=A0ABU3WTY4_9NOCA|nr:hypothetical protein [Rhodococcus zopfii]